MWTKKRHRIVFAILRPIFKLYFLLRYNLKIKTNKRFKEGAVILANHTTTLDPFILGASFRGQMYYMCSKDLFSHKFLGGLIRFLVNPIPKEKSNTSDLSAIRNCAKVAKENGTICIFPEGNRTLTGKLCQIDMSIVKMVKMLKKPLVIFNVKGGFATDPRWGVKIRRGKMTAEIHSVYQYEEYKDMPNDELLKIIIDGLDVHEYDVISNYKSRRRAEYLERLLYVCPKCHSVSTLHSKGKYVTCSACNLKVEYKKDLSLDGCEFKNLAEWDLYQKEYAAKLELGEEYLYGDKVYLTKPRIYKSKLRLGVGMMKVNANSYIFELENGDTLKFDFKDISAVTIVGKKKMNFYYQGDTYQVFGDKRINLLKYMRIYYTIKNDRSINYEFMGL